MQPVFVFFSPWLVGGSLKSPISEPNKKSHCIRWEKSNGVPFTPDDHNSPNGVRYLQRLRANRFGGKKFSNRRPVHTVLGNILTIRR
jgi:hypothetical protein